MRGNGISRGMGMAVAGLSLTGALALSQPANAQTTYCWIDAQNGHVVDADHLVPNGGHIDPADPNHISFGGRTFFRGADGSWTDAQNGHVVDADHLVPNGGHIDPADPKHIAFGGRTFVRVPCPPPSPASSTAGGGYLGGELAKNWGRVRSTESLATTDVITNRFTDSGDPLGVGIVGGYNFKPWNNNIVIGPFASFDYLNQTINHNFAGGQFLGTTTHWFINAGVKAGVVVAPGFYLYGLAGAAWLNHDLNVNFATAAQSNVTTPGFTLGLGGEYQPPSWQLAGHPVSVFAQYQHTWWSNANFNTPTSSPAFNYAFRREDDTIKLGVNFYFGVGPAAPVSSPMFVKALPAK
jgi:hypothetical protein